MEMELTQSNRQITKDEVLAKLKDDGDFDRLRLKIIRKLKDDEQLRENLSSIVRQSAALNRLGAENMKPRQLSDAIYQEVGDKLTGHISDGLWGIIRDGDGMSSEISETVQSVYSRLMNAKGISSMVPVRKEDGDKDSVHSQANEVDHKMSDGNEPKEQSGFRVSHNDPKKETEESQLSFRHEKIPVEEQEEGPTTLLQVNQELSVVDMENKQDGDCSDDDPDLPPGFG